MTTREAFLDSVRRSLARVPHEESTVFAVAECVRDFVLDAVVNSMEQGADELYETWSDRVDAMVDRICGKKAP